MTIVMVEGYRCNAQRYEGTPQNGRSVICTGQMMPVDNILVCNKCGRIALREDRVLRQLGKRRNR